MKRRSQCHRRLPWRRREFDGDIDGGERREEEIEEEEEENEEELAVEWGWCEIGGRIFRRDIIILLWAKTCTV